MAKTTNHVVHKNSNVVIDGLPKMPTMEDIKYGEIAINYAKGHETLTIKNDNDEIVKTHLGSLETDETVIALKRQLDSIASTYSIYGFARVNGDNDPKGVIFFGKDENLAQITSHACMGLTPADGKLYKRFANCRLDVAVDGTPVEIDGSDGDVMAYMDCETYFLKATVKAPVEIVEGDKTIARDTEINIIALGLSPFTLYGINAKRFEPFAFSPQYTVHGQLTTSNNKKGVLDKRSCAHSVYNKNLAGSYKAAFTWFNETFKPNGGGYFTQYVNAMSSIWMAQCKNPNEKTNRPFMGGYYEFYEIFLALMFFELKSLYHQGLDSFGCGCTLSSPADSQASFGDNTMRGNSGVMYVKSDGGKTFSRLMSTITIKNGSSSSTHPVGGLCGTDYYGYTEMLEPQRILSDIAKAGLINKIWKATEIDAPNKSVVFEYDEDGNMIVSAFTNEELATGANMTPNKKYFQVRNVPNVDGMDKGSMTAVVNIYVKLTFKAGTTVNNVDHTGGYAVYKLSHPVYKGLSLQDGMFIQMQGCHYVNYNMNGKEGFENGDYAKFICAESFEDIPPQEKASIEYFGPVDKELEMERGLNKQIWSHGCLTRAQKRSYSGWAGKDDYNMSLFCVLDHTGSINTKECQYHWNYASWSNGDSGADNYRLPAANRKCVNAVVVGCYSNYGTASARTTSGDNAVSGSGDVYAGRFALPRLTL